MPTSELARAKVNLALHVTGQRDDGYHLLDSIVVFADCGDVITVAKADQTSLAVSGPFAHGLSIGDDNSALRALGLFGAQARAKIHIEKNLPVAAGIGGGSADAAAVMRAYSSVSANPLPEPDAVLQLGADVPVCLEQRSARMRGIGQELMPVDIPDLTAVLINPGVAVSTPAVFGALASRTNTGLGRLPTDLNDAAQAINWLSGLRNDLEPAAISVAPEISRVLSVLRAQGADLARMSGSGATCFGLYADAKKAEHAAAVIAQEYPNWWVCPTVLKQRVT